MSINKRLNTDFLHTYNPPGYDDPQDAIQDYERVQRYCAQHPRQGSQAVSTALDLPRESIRCWVDDDGMPDCYRGLQTIYSNGWLIEDWNDEIARALNCLAAWTLSSGSINQNFVPTFVTDSDEEYEALRRYATIAGIGLKRTREPDGSRPPEWRPRNDASVLGRLLYTWIGVMGDKSRHEVSIPEYLAEAPEHIVREFVQVYVQQRGVYRDDRGEFIQLSADRTEGFRRGLKTRLQSVVDDSDQIRGERWPLRIYGEAIETLGQYPELIDARSAAP